MSFVYGVFFLGRLTVVQSGLVHKSVFSTEVEVIDIAFRELRACYVDLRFVLELRNLYGTTEGLEIPAAELPIVRNGYNVVGNLCTHYIQTVDWILVAC